MLTNKASVMGPLVQPQEAVEETMPQSTLTTFLAEEVRRESLKNNTAEELRKEGTTVARDAAAAVFTLEEKMLKTIMDDLQDAQFMWTDSHECGKGLNCRSEREG
jgi:hypothetical protein